MRIVLLGGTGFIGKKLAGLCQEIAEVVVVSRHFPHQSDRILGVTYLVGDCADPKFLTYVIKPGDHVVFLAYNSVPKTSFDDPLRDIQDNLPLAITLLEVLRNVQISRLLYVSSGGTVYGPTSVTSPIIEEHQTNPISPYGITKLSIEKYCRMYSNLFDIPIVIARPANPYGPNQIPFSGQGFVATAAAMMMRGEALNVFGTNGTIRDYLYIDDLCSGLLILLTADIARGSIFNIGSGNGVSNIDIIKEISAIYRIAHSDIRINFLPERRFDVPYNVLCSAKLRNLGWSPNTTLKDGLNSTINWLSNYIGINKEV